MGLKKQDWTALAITKTNLDKIKVNKSKYEAKHGKVFTSIGEYLVEVTGYLA